MELFDFSDAATVARWRPVDDVVMGGVSEGHLRPTAEGASFHGRLSLAHGGGFASVRCDVDLDLSAFRGLRLRVRGDGRRYGLRLRTQATTPSGRARLSYAAPFETGPQWSEPLLPFADFTPTFRGRELPDAPPLDPSDVTAVTLMLSDGREGPFELVVADIRAF